MFVTSSVSHPMPAFVVLGLVNILSSVVFNVKLVRGYGNKRN